MCDAKKSGPFRALTIMLTAKQDTVMPRNTKNQFSALGSGMTYLL